MTVHRKLLEVLVCPACKGPLSPVMAPSEQGADAPASFDEPSPVGLDCPACRLRYPVVDDIPVMLVDQAVRLRA